MYIFQTEFILLWTWSLFIQRSLTKLVERRQILGMALTDVSGTATTHLHIYSNFQFQYITGALRQRLCHKLYVACRNDKPLNY